MFYKITISNPSNRENNPLIKLHGTEYPMYHMACDAIGDVLVDVFRSPEGYRRLKRTPLHLAFAKYCNDDVYVGHCVGLIKKEGFAEHDGVTATVVEVAE